MNLASVGSKLLHLTAVLLAVTILTFCIVDLLPGDVAVRIVGDAGTKEDLEAVREDLGLTDPLPVRYGQWLSAVVTGDLGRSYRTGEEVLPALLTRLPVTVELLILAQVIALGLALPLGVMAAYHAGGLCDRAVTALAFGVVSLPGFVLALILILLFAVNLNWFPATGYVPLSEGFLRNVRSMLLPAVTLGLAESALYLRVLRSEMVDTLNTQFILAARAKGLPAARVLFVHALPVSSYALVTILGLSIGNLIAGAVIVETLFALPGVGRLLVDAVYARDFLMIQGVVLFIAIAYVLINFMVDVAYAMLDPRLSSKEQAGKAVG